MLDQVGLNKLSNTKETTLERAGLHPSAVNVSNRGRGGTNVYNFLPFPLLSAVVNAILGKNRMSVSRL